jgi:hypothetical protein
MRTEDSNLYNTKRYRGQDYTSTFNTKFWTPQCSECLECSEVGGQSYCGYGKQSKRLIHGNLERNCKLKIFLKK